MEPQHTSFVAGRLSKGIPQSEVRQNLMTVGWSEDDADAAIAEALRTLGAPMPATKGAGARKSASTLDVVLNFFSFILLAAVATALGVLYFQIVNRWFPDPLSTRTGVGYFSRGAIQYAIAALIVAFPLLVLTLRYWFGRYETAVERAESKLTKWLTYLVLLVTSVTIVGDLITALNYFLRGELSMRFFLKALTILVIAGVIFAFYALERRKVQFGADIARTTFRRFGWAVGALVIFGVVLGFLASGSPLSERKRTFDMTRAQDLSAIAGCVANFAADRGRIPESLEELTGTTQYQYCTSNLADPETGTPYTYRVVEAERPAGNVTEASFDLCATFSLEGTKDDVAASMPYYSGMEPSKWYIHPAGVACDTEVVVLRQPTIEVGELKAIPIR